MIRGALAAPVALGLLGGAALSGCAASGGGTPMGVPTQTVAQSSMTAAPTPTIVDPGAKKDPSTGGVWLAPTASGPLAGKTIALDPGHNLKSGGGKCALNTSYGPDQKTTEAALMWAVASKAAEQLRAQGAAVVLTRPDNAGVGPCESERARIADAKKADLLISLHADAFTDRTRRGTYAQYASGTAYGEASRAAASDLLVEMSRFSGLPVSTNAGVGGLQDSSTVMVLKRRTQGMAVVLELGNILNADDFALLNSEGGQTAIGGAIAAACTDIVARPIPTPTPTAKK